MKISYRPEIDGLRAISVLAVIIYHAKIYILGSVFLPGGYLGVDIFFVISGYLITSIILKEINTTDNFCFKYFYESRIRRILPALLLVIIVSIPFAWVFLLPTAFIDFSKSILSTLGFISNLYFYISGQIYGSENALLKPMLHTWSLSVEEQFYIIFPLIVFFLIKKNINLIIVLIISSLVLSSYAYSLDPDLVFYSLPFRIWELMSGSLLAYRYRKKEYEFNNKIIRNFLSLIGIMLIIISFVYIEYNILNISISKIFAVLGTLLIIQNCKNEIFISKILTNKIAVNIGLISYSLYLWHYPIFAFTRIGYLSHGWIENLLILIILFSLSILTFKYVERPFRDKHNVSIRKVLFIIFLLYLFIIFLITLIIVNKGFPQRFPNLNNFSLDNSKYSEEVRIKKYDLGVPDYKSKNTKKILIIGNSHGRDLFNALILNKNLFPEYEFSILDTQIYCLENIEINNSICNRKIERNLQKIFTESEVVILSSFYNDKDINSLENVLKILKYKNKKIILTTVNPTFSTKEKRLPVDEFFLQNQRLPNLQEKLELEKKYYHLLNEGINVINKKLFHISNKYNITILDKHNLLCSNEKKSCLFLTPENNKIFYDSNHYTIDGAIFIGSIIKDLNWLKIN